jgi:hypothetical protein
MPEPSKYPDRQSNEERLNNNLSAQPISKIFAMLWYIVQKQKQKNLMTPDQRLNERGKKNSDEEIRNQDIVLDELTKLRNKYDTK